jgi:hypothetical protein
MKDGFSLTTVTTLLPVVSSFPLRYQYRIWSDKWEAMEEEYLSKDTSFTGFVLGDFVDGVFSAIFTFAVSTTGLWNVDCLSASLGK